MSTPSCPNCEASHEHTSPDYGLVSWGDELMPVEVTEQNLTPFCCMSCGHGWFGKWEKGDDAFVEQEPGDFRYPVDPEFPF